MACIHVLLAPTQESLPLFLKLLEDPKDASLSAPSRLVGGRRELPPSSLPFGKGTVFVTIRVRA